MIDYSVIIRTTGKAHEKYQRLLNSIEKLEPQPKEIIVVLPEGNELPKETLGRETYYFSPKGMVIQRITGIEKCKTRYALICDDDVEFSSDFVGKLYKPLENGLGKLSIGPLYSFLPSKGINSLVCTIMASAVPTFFHKDKYTSILRTAGYSYNRNLKEGRYYYTESAAWTCFFAEIESLREIEMEAEIWLDSHGYSALDDQTMFYKAWLMEKKTVVVPEAIYKHLDAKTSTKNNKPAVIYSLNYNRVIFWHRFIFKMQKNIFLKLWSILCFGYREVINFGFNFLAVVRKRISRKDWAIAKKGSRDGWKYIKSKEYLQLPKIQKQ